jgi:hypothetical protein
MRMGGMLTRNDITCIQGIAVLNETKAIHELDFGDFSSAVGGEEGFHIGLGD